MQRLRQPENPLHYSLRGYDWCDLKLTNGRALEVTLRAKYSKDIAIRNGWLLDVALDTLSLAKVALQHEMFYSKQKIMGSSPVKCRAAEEVDIQLLDEAVARLRIANTKHHILRGLLARSAYHRAVGNDKLAVADLLEAFEIAERGGMRLFLADCWLESAFQRLARSDLSETSLIYAQDAIERTAAIIADTGYHRRAPDLALAWLSLHLARGENEKAERQMDSLVEVIRKNDLWGFMAPLQRLVVRYGLKEMEPVLIVLRAERSRFDAAADAAFEEARRRGDGLDDDVIDARLADPAFRSRLVDLMKANDMPSLTGTPVEEQREYARQYIIQVERQQSSSADTEKVDPDSIPDELVEQALADADLRKAIDEIHGQAGMPKLASLDADGQRLAARAFIAAMLQAQAQSKPQADPQAEAGPSPATPPPTDAPKHQGVLRRVFGRFMRGGS